MSPNIDQLVVRAEGRLAVVDDRLIQWPIALHDMVPLQQLRYLGVRQHARPKRSYVDNI